MATLLEARMVDVPGVTRIGQNVDGTGQYLGRIQDLRNYADTITNRY